MPIATIDTNDTHDYELKSLEGGTVTLKRLSYGDWLTRSEMAINVELGNKENAAGSMGNLSFANRAVTSWEFKNCIVDHNLTDANDAPLDFRSAATLQNLNPRVGNEIAEYIRKLHDFEAAIPN